MSFGGFGGGFGASSSPFGATSPSPFGQQTPAFGQASSPFGATTTTGVFGQSQPAFGASPAPAFGATPAFGQSQPAFGASSAPAFGATSAFGAKPAFGGFGATATSPFGASSTPAFGQSASAFGASSAPAFGASPFGGSTFGASQPAFGATSSPAFGAASAPAFGQSNLTAFGSTAFGQPTPAGGFGAGGFGAGARGTRTVAWRKTQEQDTSGSGGAKSVVYFNSISCMPEYANKSVEELRAEDYADGCKGNTGTASPAGGAFGTTTAFGASSSPFGAPSSSPAFGAASSPAFGASAPAFGATSAPAFGGFGATSAPAFGASSAPAFGGFGATAASPFGAASPSPFGQSAPAFGATGTSAFGATSSPAFGATSAPAFGGFGATSTPAFGATSAPAFGASPAPAFGAASSAAFGFGASSTPAFGAASAPAFGAQSSPGFGFGASSAPAFGATSAPAFGASSASLFGAASTPAFGGGGTSLFGATTQQPAGGFGFGAASTPAFGAAPTPAFGASSASLFGAASTPAFGGGTSLFGASQGAPTFSFAPAGQAAAAPAAGALAPAQPVQAPGVATSPYGVLPEPPKVSPAPEYKVGLTQRPAGLLPGGPPRPAALITPRSITPRSGVRMRPRRSMSATRMSKSPADFLAAAANVAGTPGGVVPGADGRGSATPNGSIFVPRENPRRLFVRDPLPSTEGAGTVSASPAGALGSTPGRPPLRTPGSGSGLRITPGRRGNEGAAEAAGASGSGGLILAENGFGPAPNGNADGDLSDGQLAMLLPALKQPDYYTEPSLQQLAAMGRDDPASLAAVANFSVGRRGVGSVRWLEPTDVRGLDLDATVQLSKGSIEVYLDEGAKPDVGHGLNKPAEVTMLRIHKLDKETGKPTSDPEAIDRFARKLKKVTAEQGARFVSYDAASGTWKFEVEHFSKYGLDSEEDSDDEELQAYGVRGQAAAAAAARQAAARRGGRGGEQLAEDEDEDGMEDSQGRGAEEAEQDMEEDEAGLDGQEPSFGALAAAAADGGLGGRQVLQVELPAQLGMEPEDLQRIRDGLFADRRQLPIKMNRVLVIPQPAEAAAGAAPSAAPSAAPAPSVAAATVGRAPLAARNAWRKHQAAPVQPAARPTAPRTPPPAGLPLLPAGPSPVSSLVSQQCPVPAPKPTADVQPPGRERCLPDAGLFSGAAFRAGWGPNAVVAYAGGRASSAAHIVVQQLAVGARVAAAGEPADAPSGFQKRQREVLEAALVLHMQHSSPDPHVEEPGDSAVEDAEDAAVAAAAGVPQWRLRCRRQEELRKLTLAYIELCTAAAAKAQGVERTVLRHQASTWEVLHVLFSAIEGEQAPGAANGPSAMLEGEDIELQLDRLAAYKRRAALSHWLRDRARPHVEAALRRGATAAGSATSATDAIAAQLLALLSGHQLAAVAAVAAATSNPRLASLLAQAGTKVLGAAELAEQLHVWEESGCEGHIAAGLRRVYQLLAGQVDEVVPSMQLDWRRALGVHLWYRCQPTATVAEALASYTAAVESGAAPPPLPLYAETAAGGSAGAPASSGSAFDVAFELLRLHAVGSDPEASSSPAKLQPLLARLLRPSGLTPDPLDYAFPWHLLTVLGAVGALPPAVLELPQAAVARMSFIAQLEAVGGLAHWAVYAALHIPDAAERARVVRELLQAHADEWAQQPEVWAFLCDQLALPAAWLAEAQALRAHYCADDAGRLDQLLDAEDWPAAHALLCDLVAPRWVLAGELGRLAAVLDRLEPHAAGVNAAGGAGAWEAGGGVYLAYLYLKELYATLGRTSSSGREAPADLSFPERMEAASRLAAMLQDASARWGLGGAAPEAQQPRRLDARPGGGALQQAVFARMSAELSKWVTSDGEGAGMLLPTPGQERLAVGLRAMPHEATAAGLQMAAVNLAQRVA